jgi:hypothetical protein
MDLESRLGIITYFVRHRKEKKMDRYWAVAERQAKSQSLKMMWLNGRI